MTFQAGAALPCRPTVAHSKHAIGMAVGMGVLWKQLRPVKDKVGQDRTVFQGHRQSCVFMASLVYQ